MKLHSSSLDTSNELLLQKHTNGIKLIRPKEYSEKSNIITSISKLIELPFNFFILDSMHNTKKVNTEYVETYGFSSEKDALIKTNKSLFSKRTSNFLIKENLNVLQNKQSNLFEANIRFSNKASYPILSKRLPIFNCENQIIGLLGFTCVMGKHGIPDFINFLNEYCFLGSLANHKNSCHEQLPGKIIDHIYLTERQKQVLHYIIRGKSSKEIGKALGLSYRTIQHYLDNIKLKFNVSTQADLINKVIDELYHTDFF